jgi:TorA maturation chaperone TorD
LSFFAPDEELIESLAREKLPSFLQMPGGEKEASNLLAQLCPDTPPAEIFPALRREYDRLFTGTGEEKVSLVESTHKSWTGDRKCPLAFAGERGLLLGDSALHMLDIFGALSWQIPEPMKSTPDHLVLELEFLSWLYRAGIEIQIQRFVADHLDWISSLKEQLEASGTHVFYRKAVALLDLFLRKERELGKGKDDGPSSVH